MDQKKRFLDVYVQGNILAMEAKAQNIDKKKAMQTRIAYVTMGLLAQEYSKDVIAKASKVTDADIKKYYESHKVQFATPAMVAAKHILIKVNAPAKPEEEKADLAKIEEIKKELNGGAMFEKMAEKYSDDPASKSKGGDLGLFPKERVVPEFAQTAFALKKGEISIPTRIMAEHMLKSVQRVLTPEGRMKLAQKAPAAKERDAIAETEQKQSLADVSLFITCGNCTVEFRKTDLPPGGKCPVCGKRLKVATGKDR